MSRKLTLRLNAADIAEFARAAANIAGPDGAEFVNPMVIVRRSVAALNAEYLRVHQDANK